MGKFKVGDKVRVVRAHESHYGKTWVRYDKDAGVNIGDTGVVTRFDGYLAHVDFKAAKNKAMNHEQLELIKQPASPKFEVGDPVRLLKDGLSTTGATGLTAVVMGLDMNGGLEVPGDIWVTIDGGQKPFKSLAVGGMDTRVDADGIELIKQPAATNAKFKAGDRVFIPFMLDETGVGVVQEVTSGGVRVEYKTWYGICVETADSLVLESAQPQAPTASAIAIVAAIENGTPKPTARPRIHDTEASATTEAERLAKLNPGQTFGVFVQTTARVVDVTVRVV